MAGLLLASLLCVSGGWSGDRPGRSQRWRGISGGGGGGGGSSSSHIQAALGGRCGLTTWSRDGFGHQLAAALSCEAWAMANASYIYVRSNHTALEHHPSNASTLLGWLNRHTQAALQSSTSLSACQKPGTTATAPRR